RRGVHPHRPAGGQRPFDGGGRRVHEARGQVGGLALGGDGLLGLLQRGRFRGRRGGAHQAGPWPGGGGRGGGRGGGGRPALGGGADQQEARGPRPIGAHLERVVQALA